MSHKNRLLGEEASQKATGAVVLFTGTDVHRDQPQRGIAGIPREGKCEVTTGLLVELRANVLDLGKNGSYKPNQPTDQLDPNKDEGNDKAPPNRQL